MKTNKNPRQKLPLERIREIASRHQTRKSFATNDASAYQMAWRNGWLDDVCQHMSISPVYSDVRWDRDRVMIEALKYKSRSAFKRGCSGAYCHALNSGFLDDACAHMSDAYRKWTDEDLAFEAAKYSTRKDFQSGSYSAYRHAHRRGMIDAVCAHMEGKMQWDRDSVIAEAAKYSIRSEFRMMSGGAYNYANAHGFLDEACAHMEPGKCGFNPERPAVLYCLKITGAGISPLFKVGITNRDARLRVHGMGVRSSIKVEVLQEVPFESGATARAREKALHSKFRHFRYSGAPVLGNGNTEIFTVNLLTGVSE